MIQLILSIPFWLIPFLILLLSVVALAIALERLWFFQKKLTRMDPKQEAELLSLARTKDSSAILDLLSKGQHPLFQLWKRLEGVPPENLSAWLSLELPRVFAELRRGLYVLGTISTIAPLFGLLGTVTGMIQAFHAFASGEGAKSLELTGGIDQALITTALGLFVAIPSLVAYNYFANKANQISDETEGLAQILVREMQR